MVSPHGSSNNVHLQCGIYQKIRTSTTGFVSIHKALPFPQIHIFMFYHILVACRACSIRPCPVELQSTHGCVPNDTPFASSFPPCPTLALPRPSPPGTPAHLRQRDPALERQQREGLANGSSPELDSSYMGYVSHRHTPCSNDTQHATQHNT